MAETLEFEVDMSPNVELESTHPSAPPETQHASENEPAATAALDRFDLGIPPEGRYPSLDALKESVQDFARRHGYELVLKRPKYNAFKEIYKYHFQCKRGGTLDNTRRLTSEQRKRLNRTSIRTDCQMRLIIAASVPGYPGGAWEVRHSSNIHNHPADQTSALPGHRRRDIEGTVKSQIAHLDNAGVSPRQIETFLKLQHPDKVFLRKDIYNTLAEHRRNNPGQRPPEALRTPMPNKPKVDAPGSANSGSKKRKSTSTPHQQLEAQIPEGMQMQQQMQELQPQQYQPMMQPMMHQDPRPDWAQP